MLHSDKPTLGVIPKHLHDEIRFKDLQKAIYDRVSHSQKIPLEWVEEYNNIEVKYGLES